MAHRYDALARLAEGREAVAHTQAYVTACHRRGYRHPDLTGYDGQLADRYDSEAGLDLGVLDADCAALRALADAADDTLNRQRGQLGEFAAAWRGPGAEAATDFLRRHCEAGAELTARLRAAATGCEVLRAELWRLVDTKVAAVLAVDDWVGAQRPAWLAAAHAVSSGADDERAAEVIEKQVMPYVDNDVRGEWVSAVRAARDGVAAAYRTAVAAADPAPGVVFAIPGDLAPVAYADEPVPVAPVVPAALVAPVAPGPAPVDVPLDASDVPAEQAASPATVTPTAPLGDMPADLGIPPGLGMPGDLGLPSGGLPTGGGGGLGGLGGLIPRLADAFGDPGLGDSLSDPFDDPARVDDHDSADPDDSEPGPESEPESGPADDAVEEAEAAEPTEAEPAAGETEAAPEAEPAAEPAEETAATEETEQAPEPPADVLPKTPCEIAAEELPQVGQ